MSAENKAPNSVVAWIRQQLRIDAIRGIFSTVEVTRVELWGLISLALIYAFSDGVGLSVLLPVLQYAETGDASLGASGNPLWAWPGQLATAMHIPLNLVTLLVIAFIPVILRQVATYLNTWFSAVVANRIGVRLRVNTYETLMAADPDFFSSRPQGEFTSIVFGQTGVAGNMVLLVMKMMSIALQAAIYVVMLSVLSFPLTVMAALAVWFVSLLVRKNLRRTAAFGKRVTEITQKSYGSIAERIALARLVKMRAQEKPETENIRRFSEEMSSANVSITKLGARIEVTADPLLMLSAFMTLYLGIAVLGLKLAELGMLLYVLTRLNGKVKEMNGARQGLSAGMSGLNLVREVTAEARAASTINDGPVPFTGARDSIEFHDVWFSFPGAEEPTLRGLSVRIEAGSFTALVGRSGAGKSTFVELLPRLRDASSGSVTYDGTDVREFGLSGLRRGIGYLTQDAMLLNDTVRGNLVYGLEREVSDAAINHALEQAYATFVLDLPEGLETRLRDRGVRFSGGERQRLALARVLLADPDILILDEPTSALDSESEQYIQSALTALHGKKTIIVIAHRLATVVAADQLLVVEAGRIAQRGVHDELVNVDGAYKSLFESQLLRG